MIHAFASDATAAFAVATAASTTKVSLSDIVASLFAADWREQLAAETGGDHEDAAFAWGM
jgi:hypothetical protein